jgi:hypothetical protein
MYEVPVLGNTATGGGIMVKGISRQVIVVHSPDPQLFEQAIFILRDGQKGVSDEALMKEAKRLISMSHSGKKNRLFYAGPVWACGGALLTCVVWLITALL